MEARELIGLIGLVVLLGLLALRAPVGVAMVLTAIGGNFALSLATSHLRFEPYLKQFKTLLWSTVSNYELSVVPLFILMGYISAHSGLSRHLFHGICALTGKLRGGTAMATVGACAGFGAVCGSSLATASTMGRIALPELQRQGYAPGFAAAVLASGGTLGILIPPSVALVIYAIIVEASIIEMFQAAMIPGLIAVAFFLLVIMAVVRLRPDADGRPEIFDSVQRRQAIYRALPVAGIFILIVLGLGMGLFTPTPAAAVGVFAVLGYGAVLRRRGDGEGLTADGLRQSLLDTAKTAGMIYFILFGAEVLKGFFSRSGLPAALSTWAMTAGWEPWLILILILLIFLVLGCFMDSLSMILVMVPFFCRRWWTSTAAISLRRNTPFLPWTGKS